MTTDTLTALDWPTLLGYPGATVESLRLYLCNWHSADEHERQQFPKVWGARIKAAGGSYRDVRGGGKRVVDLPATPYALAVAEELIRTDPYVGKAAAKHSWDDQRPGVYLRVAGLWRIWGQQPSQTSDEYRGHGATLDECIAGAAARLDEEVRNNRIIAPADVEAARARYEAGQEENRRIDAERAAAKRLADAAPALLKALRLAEDALDDITASLPDAAGIADPALDQIRAAIALATEG